MVGVVRSNRCGTCRRRKVKCDEVKPVCGQCQVGQRICEPPVSRVKFTKPKILSPRHRHEPIRRTVPLISALQPALSTSPPLSATETLQYVLVETFMGTNIGYNLSVMAKFIEDIPPRLGQSSALDDAIACLVHRRVYLINGQIGYAHDKQDRMYMKAIRSLDAAIRDPVEGYSDNTLCAVSILAEVELLGGGLASPYRNNYIVHAGGAARLIQHRGPERHQSHFARTLLAYRRGSCVAESIVRGDDCFLSSPKWTDLTSMDYANDHTESITDNLARVLVQIPTVLKNIRKLSPNANSLEKTHILHEAQRLRRDLQNAGCSLDDNLTNESPIIEVPSTHSTTVYPMSYTFTSREVAVACSLYWSFSIVLDTIIVQYLPTAYSAQVKEALIQRCVHNRQRIIMSYEYALGFWPLGSLYLTGALIISFHGASEDQRDWIVQAMAKLGEHMSTSEPVWNRGNLEGLSRLFVGDWIGYLKIFGEIYSKGINNDPRSAEQN